MIDENLFCTLAIGERYHDLAAFLCADLAVYDQALLIVTDRPEAFEEFSNAITVQHVPEKFSYHDKKLAIRAALERARTAVFVDADTCIHFWADRRSVGSALRYRFSPGLHAWRLYPEGLWEYPNVEAFAIAQGMFFRRNVITYSEGLFAVSAHPGLERFFALWDVFHTEANRVGHNGAGEGTCIGIAAEAAPIPRMYTTEMLASNLPFFFWHTRLSFAHRKLHHVKFAMSEALRGNLNTRMHSWALR
jgi:hypothetical protein